MTDAVRQPDLSVYYDRSKLETESSETNLTYVESSIYPLYTTPDLTQPIGNFILDNKAYIQSSVEIVRLSNIIVVLPFGTLSTQRTLRARLTISPLSNVSPNISAPNSLVRPNQTIAYTILSGNEDFLGSKGYLTITTDNTSIRRMDIWFDKQ